MTRIESSILIHAPIQVVFDAERNVSTHTSTQKHRRERAVSGTTSGFLKLHDEIEWEAIHFGIRQRLKAQISEMHSPTYFKDEMISGAFRSLSHEHHFEEIDAVTTLKKDIVVFSAPFGLIGNIAEKLFLKIYMIRFLNRKNADFKHLVELNTNTVEQGAAANPYPLRS